MSVRVSSLAYLRRIFLSERFDNVLLFLEQIPIQLPTCARIARLQTASHLGDDLQRCCSVDMMNVAQMSRHVQPRDDRRTRRLENVFRLTIERILRIVIERTGNVKVFVVENVVAME